jgi:predicted nucleotidyltransferase
MKENERQTVTRLLRAQDGVEAAWLFGSVARDDAQSTSDLDVAVLGHKPLSAEEKGALIEQLAQTTGRPVDLVDLQSTHGPIVGRILQNGVRLFCDDTALYAGRMKRWWLDQTDWMPYRRRILKERRERWIES